MATVVMGGDGRVSIGRVMSRAFGMVAAAPVATLGIAFLFGALPGTLIALLSSSARVAGLADGTVTGVTLLTLLVTVTSAMLTQGALGPTAVAQSEGRRADLRGSAAAGLRALLPLAMIGVLVGAGVLFGLMILMVPGIMLGVIWSVAAPAAVVERLGPLAALGRSRELTRGVRWRVFGLLGVVLLIHWLVSALSGVLGVVLFGGSANALIEIARAEPSVGLTLLAATTQTLVAALWGLMIASLYVELRTAREGPASAALAEIFR